MRHQFNRACAVFFLLCSMYTILHAESIQITYDGQTHTYDLSPISLFINNSRIETMIMPPIQLGDRVLVPAREVFEPMGATVEWRAEEAKVYVYDTTSLLVLEVNKPEAFVNGQIQLLDMPPKIINNKLLIPIRFISEQLGYNVMWQGEQRVVLIDKPEPTPVEILPTELDTLPVEPTQETQQPIQSPLEPVATWESTLTGIGYLQQDNTLILEKPFGLLAEHITITDLYRERRVIINLNGNYADVFTQGILIDTTGRIRNVVLNTNEQGNTQLIIDTSLISAVNIYEQDEKIYIQFVKPNEKYQQIVVLDPGHGGSDPGARSASGIAEKELNLRYALDAYALLLQHPDIKVYITRETDFKPTLQERAIWANEIGAHLFISIHNNSINNVAINGTETYYFSNEADTRSQDFAKMIQAGIVQNFAMTDRKAKAGNAFYVLKNTTMPAVLLEIGFMSSEQDMAKLTQPDFSPRLARIIEEAVKTYFQNGNHLVK